MQAFCQLDTSPVVSSPGSHVDQADPQLLSPLLPLCLPGLGVVYKLFYFNPVYFTVSLELIFYLVFLQYQSS